MTDLRKAAEMALEALESAENGMNECFNETGFDFANEQYEAEQAIKTLRQALEQSEQEPVGQLQEDAYGRGQVLWFNKPPDKTMLYTAPPSLEVAVLAERKRIVNLFMIQHEAAKGAHNYWQVAANLVQADQGLNSGD